MKNYTAYFSAIFFLITLFLNFLINKEKLVIVQNGNSTYNIVIPDNPSNDQYKAANILQSYLFKISSCKLPIHTQKKQSNNGNHIYLKLLPSQHPKQINIATDENNLIFNAGSDLALIHSIYDFLDQSLGCLWLAPGVEKIPTSSFIKIDADYKFQYLPKIETRTVHSRLFYNNPEFALKHKVTAESFPYYVPEARVHTFNKFISEEKFYKSHPEYFALRNGTRLPTQLCLTNKNVLQIVKDSVEAMFARNPQSSVISVSTNDNTQFCTCETCKKIDEEEGSQAGTVIRFVNEVAKEHPTKQISTLAYQYTRKPCKSKPLDNVLITLCSIECDRSASIPEKCKDFAEDLRGWKKLTENIRIWDYTTQFTNFLSPFPNMHTLKPNIEFFRDNNAKWIFEQHSNNPSELFELRSFVMAKLLWNPNLDYNALLREFTDGYYEDAGPFIKEYVDLIHSKIKKEENFFLFLYGDPSQAFDSYLSAELLSAYENLFDRAELAVQDKTAVLKRVRNARLGIDYAILEACRKSLSEQFNLDNQDKLQTLLQSFKSRTADANITLMNEMGLKVTEYIEFYEKTLSFASLPNIARGKKVELLTKAKKYANENPLALTDGAYGGSSFYSNWLGFEGKNLEAIIDLEKEEKISSISTAFLQVTNHIVFFPTKVSYYGSQDGSNFNLIGSTINAFPLEKKSKINSIQYYRYDFNPKKTRYIKIVAENLQVAPFWHHAAGLPSWIFADEVIIN